MSDNYNNESIEETLGEKNQVRTRTAIYFGTNDIQGCINGVFELVTNGADELSNNDSNGSKVATTVENDPKDPSGSYIVTVVDDGRGVPMDWNPKLKKYNWHLVYNQLFASGKRGGSSAYAGAAGLNGVGAAITQFTSEFMIVISRRIEDGQKVEYEMHFVDGDPQGELIKREWTTGDANVTGLKGTGTYVKYKTDKRFFLGVRYTFEQIADRLRKLATVAYGQTYTLKFLDEQEIQFKFDSPSDFLTEITTERIIKDPIVITASNIAVDDMYQGKPITYNIGVDITMTFSNAQGYVECYHNNSYVCENGTHYLGLLDALKDSLTAFGQKEGKFDKKEKVMTSDLEDILCVIAASSIDNGEVSAWAGQDKRAIKNETLYSVFREIVTDKFRDWLTTHKPEGLKLVEAIKLRKEAREKADQIKKKLVKQMTSDANTLKNRPAKLHDCSSRDTTKNEIFIVEGDSAEGSVLTARDSILQASYPLTGVILNCEKAKAEQILMNRVIRELIQICGCGITPISTDKHFLKVLKDLPQFDLKKLNYSKIIILTDADVDGGHIACLLIVFFAKLMPELLRQGKVYIAKAPLFKINYANKTYKYCYSDEERDNCVAAAKQYNVKITHINRFKGLGEMEPEEMSESVMEPATRRLIPVEFNDEKGFHSIMQDLLGDNLDERKAWIRDFFEMTSEAEMEAEEEYLLEGEE